MDGLMDAGVMTRSRIKDKWLDDYRKQTSSAVCEQQTQTCHNTNRERIIIRLKSEKGPDLYDVKIARS